MDRSRKSVIGLVYPCRGISLPKYLRHNSYISLYFVSLLEFLPITNSLALIIIFFK